MLGSAFGRQLTTFIYIPPLHWPDRKFRFAFNDFAFFEGNRAGAAPATSSPLEAWCDGLAGGQNVQQLLLQAT